MGSVHRRARPYHWAVVLLAPDLTAAENIARRGVPVAGRLSIDGVQSRRRHSGWRGHYRHSQERSSGARGTIERVVARSAHIGTSCAVELSVIGRSVLSGLRRPTEVSGKVPVDPPV